MAVTAFWYGNGMKNILSGAIDLDTDTFRAMLSYSTYTPDQDTHDFRNDITGEVTGTGYTAGGVSVSALQVTFDAASNEVRWDHSDPTWTGASFSARYMVVYKSRAGGASADELVYYVNFGADEVVSSGTFTYVVPATGTGVVTVS